MIEKNSVTAKQKDHKNNHDLLAILFVCIGYLGYSIMDALSKWLVTEIPLAQITMIINGISALMLTMIIAKKEGLKGFKIQQVKLHLLRILFFLGVPYSVLKSLSILQLSEFYPILFLTPLALIISSFFFLGERLERTKIFMTFVGLIGVMFVVQGSITTQWEGFFYAFIAVLCLTGNTTILRKIKQDGSKYTLSLYPALALALVYAPFGIKEYQVPSDPQWIVLIIAGIAVFIGQVGCVLGFTKASSTSTVAPYHYTQMIWGIILGYLIFEHTPSTSALIGSVLIIYSGLFIAMFTTSKSKD
ncbi:MAG: DMT family transporter [Bdellovibrionales bacterium]